MSIFVEIYGKHTQIIIKYSTSKTNENYDC